MAYQIQPSDGSMINYEQYPVVHSLRDFTIGGKVQSIGWLHPPNFLRAVTSNLILAKTAVHDRDSGRVLLRYQGKKRI